MIQFIGISKNYMGVWEMRLIFSDNRPDMVIRSKTLDFVMSFIEKRIK